MVLTLIPALGRVKQEDGELQASLDYKARSCLKKTNLPPPKKKANNNKNPF
jgi:hypothetical protein